jgi:hypothetical protein
MACGDALLWRCKSKQALGLVYLYSHQNHESPSRNVLLFTPVLGYLMPALEK